MPKRPEEGPKEFTSRQVGVLVENLEKKLDTVLELVTALHEDMISVKDRLEKVENRLTTLEDAVRIAIPTINKRLDKIEAKVGV